MKNRSNLYVGNGSIAVSIGEPAGIGPDIILQAWSQREAQKLPHFTVIGDIGILDKRARALGLHVPTKSVDSGAQAQQTTNMLPVIELSNRMQAIAGTLNPDNSAGIIEAIERGVNMVVAGEFSALTTCPINKKALLDKGFQFPGHTEFLAHISQNLTGNTAIPVMMLAGPKLRCVPITVHIPLCQVKHKLDAQSIIQAARITARELQSRFALPDPVLVVAGLNPHAGEDGTIGREELDVIIPAVKQLQKEGLNITGPLPADTMFHQRARAGYDVALCMYHDQALIPAKTLGFDDAVNVTLGLPFIRTSPDHGTALELAATGTAKPDSFIAALTMAAEMVACEESLLD